MAPQSRLKPGDRVRALLSDGVSSALVVWVKSIARATTQAGTRRRDQDPSSHLRHPSRERLARFEREARILASLNHPHIGAIYGLEDADGIPALGARAHRRA